LVYKVSLNSLRNVVKIIEITYPKVVFLQLNQILKALQSLIQL